MPLTLMPAGVQTIGNQMPVIQFDGTAHVGSMSINNVGSLIDTHMRKMTQIATVLAEETLRTLGKMCLVFPLCTSVERPNQKIT